MRESTLERKITETVRRRGGLCLKWVSPGFTGVPDRIIIMPGGRITFAEIKRPDLADGRTLRQKRVAEQLAALGCDVVKINSMDELEVIL